MITLINDARLNNGQSTLGWIHPSLYQNAALFTNDITSGNNFCPESPDNNPPTCCQQGFNATKGWDPTTGLGSINFKTFYAFYTSKQCNFVILRSLYLFILQLRLLCSYCSYAYSAHTDPLCTSNLLLWQLLCGHRGRDSSVWRFSSHVRGQGGRPHPQWQCAWRDFLLLRHLCASRSQRSSRHLPSPPARERHGP